MRRNLLILFLVILMNGPNLHGSSSKKMIKIKSILQIQPSTQNIYTLGLDITSINPGERTINVLASEKEIEQIKKMGFTTEVLIDDINSFAQQLRTSGYLENFRSPAQILAEMNEIVAKYPEIVKLEDIGDSYEKTVDRGGHDIWVLKISDKVQIQEDEAEVFYFANMHAREIITPEIIMYFMHSLVEKYNKDPYITYLINNRQIYLCPTMNPDGLGYVLSGSNPLDQSSTDPIWWRKNKSDNNKNNKFDPNSDGVDLNRNFGYEWGRDDNGSSPYTSSDTYRGSGPFSEPESQAIRDFVLKHQFKISISFHSYSQLWLFPWGYAYNKRTPDHQVFVAMADSCVAYNKYVPQLASDLYIVNGDTDDWLYGEQELKNKIFAFTPEVGNEAESVGRWTGFFPDTMYIKKQILENQGPLLYLAYAAGEVPVIETQPLPDKEDDGPYQVKATIKPPLVLTNVVELDAASFKLYYNTTGVAPFDSLLLTSTENSEEFVSMIPGFGGRKTIYYYLAASDKFGRTGFAPRTAPFQLFSFTIRPDTIAPVITHLPLKNQSVYYPSLIFKATVEDQAGIEKVMLYFRQNKGARDSLEMQFNHLTNEYQCQLIPDSLHAGDLIEYRMLAIDKSQNRNRTIVPAAGFYRFYILPGLLFDFEADNGNFKATRGHDWSWGKPTSGPGAAHSGNNVWATNLSGNYQNNADSYLDSPALDLKNMSQIWLSFWHWYEFEYSRGALWDGGNVKISVNGGPFEVIKPNDGYDGTIDSFNSFLKNQPAFGGALTNGNFWHQDFFDLSAYANQTIVIRFHIGSDDNTPASGWYIDDVQIFMSPSNPPVITNTLDYGSTRDEIGPYLIQSKIRDDKGIIDATLFFSTDSGKNFQMLNMAVVNDSIYQAEIPGQTTGTQIAYYIQAIDTDHQISTDPVDAPTRSFQFLVTDKLPVISIFTKQNNYTIDKDEKIEDYFGITNLGKMKLNFQIQDSLLNQNFFMKLAEDSHPNENLLKKLAFKTGVPWIFFSPQSGNLGEDDSVRINFTIDGELANPGNYQVLFLIKSNDPVRPFVDIKLSISILSGMQIGEEPPSTMPTSYLLEQNFPNPFNPSTVIRFCLPVVNEIKISITNIQGQEVMNLFEGQKTAGFHTLQWNGCDATGQRLTNGIYFLSMRTEKFSQIRKMILLQ